MIYVGDNVENIYDIYVWYVMFLNRFVFIFKYCKFF